MMEDSCLCVNLETFQLVVSVHDQLRLVSIHSHQDHVLRTVFQVTADELVRGSISEVLEEDTLLNPPSRAVTKAGCSLEAY